MNLTGKYVLKQTDTAVHWLKKYSQTKGEPDLHALRVSLKKLRTFAAFASFLKLHPHKRKFIKKNLKFIAHEAGIIRDVQLIIKWVKENRYHLLLQQSFIEKKQLLTEELFINSSKKYQLKIKGILQLAQIFTKQMHRKVVLHYLQNKQQLLFEQINNATVEQWHNIRKAIKELLYALHWLPENEKIKIIALKQLKNLDLLQVAIGNWHDAQQIKTWLSEEQFFLTGHKRVKLQFNKSWKKIMQAIEANSKIVLSILKKTNNAAKPIA